MDGGGGSPAEETQASTSNRHAVLARLAPMAMGWGHELCLKSFKLNQLAVTWRHAGGVSNQRL